ncbi:MAG: hypothetical protein WC685_08410 [Methylobacter sp.]|jgi:hypothetical protein
MAIDWTQFEKQFADLRKSFAKPTSANAPDGTDSAGGYDLSSIQTQIGTAQQKLDSAQSALKNYYTTRYDQEYNTRGLGDIKTKIANLDSKIAGEKGTRDESISKTRRNPYYSAATITGESSEIERLANSTINNYVDERNSLAGEYNSTLDEVTKKVAAETGEKEREVDELKYNLASLTKQMSDYKDTLRSELDRESDDQHWEAEFMLKLQEADQRAKEASNGGSGNSTAGERFSARIGQGLEPDASLRATAERLISQGINDPTRLGYSGDLAVQLESEIAYLRKQSPEKASAPAQASGTTAESTFRREVRDAWKEGYNAEQLKQVYGSVQFSDSKKSASEIIDDEWRIKTAGGVGGFLGRLFRIGV